jgi:predicted RNA binding protein YcfA (HicA-like mRNA interferase family)
MSQIDKLVQKLLSVPKDFTFQEMVILLNKFGYSQVKGGKTGGSRVTFSNKDNDCIRVHKPHPRNILKEYQVKKLIKDLRNRGLL